MKAWVDHHQRIRRFNMAMAVLLALGLLLAFVLGGFRALGIAILVEALAGGLFLGMANVALRLATPSVNASADEIRAAAAAGPRWLKRLVAKLDTE